MKAASKKEATSPRKELVREEFLTKAADVFEKKGFASTTIQDVAQALQFSRSALYHYFKSKDEIREALVLEHTEYAAEQMELKFATRKVLRADQLRELLANSINGRMTGGARLRVLDQLATEMPAEIKQNFDHGRRRVLDLYTRLIQKGIDAGELRPLDARTAAFAILGIASWTSWWYSPTGRKSPEELASVLVDIAFNGIVQPLVGAAQGAPKPERTAPFPQARYRAAREIDRPTRKREGRGFYCWAARMTGSRALRHRVRRATRQPDGQIKVRLLIVRCPAPFAKNIPLRAYPKSNLYSAHPVPQRGDTRSSRPRGGMRWTRMRAKTSGAGWTAKSRGPDAPTLASSSAEAIWR